MNKQLDANRRIDLRSCMCLAYENGRRVDWFCQRATVPWISIWDVLQHLVAPSLAVIENAAENVLDPLFLSIFPSFLLQILPGQDV